MNVYPDSANCICVVQTERTARYKFVLQTN